MAHRLTPTSPKSWDSMAMACGRKDDVAQMNRCDENMENWVNRIGIHLEKVCRGEWPSGSWKESPTGEGGEWSFPRVQHLHVREAEDPYLEQENEKGQFL